MLLTINPVDALVVVRPSFPPQQQQQAAVPPASSVPGLDPKGRCQWRIQAILRAIVIRAAMESKKPTDATAADLKRFQEVIHGSSLRCGRYQFLELTSLSIWISSAWSATIRFSRRFSSSACFQAFGVANVHAAEFGFPAVERALGNAVFTTQIRDCDA